MSSHTFESSNQGTSSTTNFQKMSFSSNLFPFLWPLYGIGQAIIFSSCGFFFFPHLFSAIADWMSTIIPHMV